MADSESGKIPEVSVVIPVYKNEQTLEVLVARVSEALEGEGYSFEMIFVNDASPDGSRAVLESLEKERETVRVHHHERNLGQNRALMNGLALVKGRRVVVMDADLQDIPEYIPALLKKAEGPNRAVFLRRHGMYQSKARMLTSRLYKLPIQWLTGLHYRAGSFFVVDRAVVKRLSEIPVQEPVVTVMVASLASELVYVPGDRAHNDGQSGYSFFKRIAYARKGVACALACRRWVRSAS